ncbi:GRIP domain-containing protein RUD3-like [Nicotiana sylvestris]|uniref:GRIP domain-containing protein RUD3-like n=1 Tax=Nicotiana sylvestris TaxID=4096 RepID=UPI00388C9733
MEVEEIEHGQNGEFMPMLECLIEGGNKEQSALQQLSENSLQNDLALERLNMQMDEMLEALEVQKALEVNNNQKSSLEVESENHSLALDQNKEELSNAQNKKMMLMLKTILENEEKQNIALEDLKKVLTENDDNVRIFESPKKILVEAHYAHQLESVKTSQEESDYEEKSELYFEESRIEHPPSNSMSVNNAKKNIELESTSVNENWAEIDSSSREKEDVKIRIN